jgi:hypothetical protein
MSDIYVLKDPVYNEYASKTNNFTLEWLKWFPYAKIAPKQHDIKKDDILIINLYDGNPYGQYNIPTGCKKIFIVHKLSKDNIKYLSDATHIIFINKYQKQVADIFGIKRPSTICPRHPLHNYSVSFNTDPYVYIGGWFFDDRHDGLLERIEELHNTLPDHLEFIYFFIWGDLNSRKEKIDSFFTTIRESKAFKKRPNILITDQIAYNTMLFRTRTAEYSYLWRNEPNIEESLDLIASKNESILDTPIYESSMLSHFQSGHSKVIAEDKLCFAPAHIEADNFTYKDFGNLIKEVTNSI